MFYFGVSRYLERFGPAWLDEVVGSTQSVCVVCW